MIFVRDNCVTVVLQFLKFSIDQLKMQNKRSQGNNFDPMEDFSASPTSSIFDLAIGLLNLRSKKNCSL
jgi:hypothetical protein